MIYDNTTYLSSQIIIKIISFISFSFISILIFASIKINSKQTLVKEILIIILIIEALHCIGMLLPTSKSSSNNVLCYIQSTLISASTTFNTVWITCISFSVYKSFVTKGEMIENKLKYYKYTFYLISLLTTILFLILLELSFSIDFDLSYCTIKYNPDHIGEFSYYIVYLIFISILFLICFIEINRNIYLLIYSLKKENLTNLVDTIKIKLYSIPLLFLLLINIIFQVLSIFFPDRLSVWIVYTFNIVYSLRSIVVGLMYGYNKEIHNFIFRKKESKVIDLLIDDNEKTVIDNDFDFEYLYKFSLMKKVDTSQKEGNSD